MSGPDAPSGAEPMSDDSREARLVRRAVAGDQVALTTLLAECRGRIVQYLKQRLPKDLSTEVDAEDVVQAALVEVFRHVGTFEDRGPGSFFRWVATIGLRKLRDAIRLRRAAKRGYGQLAPGTGSPNWNESLIALIDLVAAPGRSPSQSVARGEAIRAVEAALAGLPEDYRRAIWLVNIEGKSAAAAAAEMGRTERAIHNLCHKGRERLRELLGSGSRFLSRRD
jgi:RNA polymerase sigma-70 factor (ECF subfamily)